MKTSIRSEGLSNCMKDLWKIKDEKKKEQRENKVYFQNWKVECSHHRICCLVVCTLVCWQESLKNHYIRP